MLLDARSYPIQQVLEQYLEPANLAYALRVWSTHYITQPNISLQGFVDDFYTKQPLTISSYALYSNLLPAMMSALQARSRFTGELINGYEFPDYDLDQPDSTPSHAAVSIAEPAPETTRFPEQTPPPASQDTEPDHNHATDTPEVTLEKTTEPAEPDSPARDEKFIIFSRFIRQLLNHINPERREKMLYRNRMALKSTCKPDVAEPFYQWLDSDEDYFQHDAMEIKEMSAVTHVVYLGLCEYQGPVEADRILMKVAGQIKDAYPFASLDINQLL